MRNSLFWQKLQHELKCDWEDLLLALPATCLMIVYTLLASFVSIAIYLMCGLSQ